MHVDEELLPYKEAQQLRAGLNEAKKNREQDIVDKLTKKLVKLYVTQGEYFKMGDRPDPYSAKSCLNKALLLQADHPVANYRLAYLFYREGEYAKAVTHFERAITGSVEEGLNDTQSMLAQMFLVNCGMKIAYGALKDLSDLEGNVDVDIDTEKIERYEKEILVLDEQIFNKMFYCKITNGIEESISEYEFNTMKPDINEAFLKCSGAGREILFMNAESPPLNITAFYIVYSIFTAFEHMTYKKIQEKTAEWGRKLSEDNIRQNISRLSNGIPFWDCLFQTTRIENKEGRLVTAIKLADGIQPCILTRGNEVLPDQQ
ncbi:tetratricopeptide repeat protein [Bacillus sp. T33-2]|uniref:tetratricopeptide repeat protein n=1 Tax=Bacillus sp. T33-2 TaxID=2054168 RepID=UPI000C78B826|nr:tetratricopeptide repeat protein [Bacillus sp. T33-2]PLR98528.1 hypothetical protein CVD19_05520 [Bacillus sp. T33-2]